MIPIATRVYESSAYGPREYRSFESFEAAETYVLSLEPVFYERDADHPGCADAFLKGGQVLCVAPMERG